MVARKIELFAEDTGNIGDVVVMEQVTAIDRYLVLYMNKLLGDSATLAEMEKGAKINDTISKKYKCMLAVPADMPRTNDDESIDAFLGE